MRLSFRRSAGGRGARSVRFRPVLDALEARWVPAITLPPNFSASLVATGLGTPTAMEFAPDGRLFVLDKSGQVRVVKNGTLLSAPFVSLNVDAQGERGLLGIAFDPNFNANHFVYLYYTVPTPAHNRVSRFTASGDVAVPGSEVDLLDLNNLSAATNHNGGAIHFGLDGKLYIGVGDNANGANSQTLTNLLGKMLRINPDGSIPTDNPFYTTAAGVNRAIWALGLRNPFTFAIQPGTGRMFIDDVGQNTWEEIDDGIAGSNYGWPITEGPTTDPRFRGPLFAYGHGMGDTVGCAIVGGTFYNPASATFPASYLNTYFFQDLCNGWIRDFNPATGTASGFATGIGGLLVDLKVDAAGNLYFLQENDPNQSGAGSVYRIQYNAPLPTPSLAVYNPAYAEWITTGPVSGPQSVQFGAPSTDIPLPGDYDGDGKPDLAVYRPSTAQWFIRLSSGGARVLSFGQPGVDIPVPADYDGDGKTDLAVFRPTTDEWFILQSSAGPRYQQLGQPNIDMPVPADYDGDHKADIAVFRPYTAQWFILQSTAGPKVIQFGASNQDLPIPADYDNDGKADPAVYRRSTSTWFIQQSTAGPRSFQLGQPFFDIPVIGDFDGDGLTDVAAYHPQTGVWSLLESHVGAQTFAFGQANLEVPLNPPLAFRWQGGLARSASLSRAASLPAQGVAVRVAGPPDSIAAPALARDRATPRHTRRGRIVQRWQAEPAV